MNNIDLANRLVLKEINMCHQNEFSQLQQKLPEMDNQIKLLTAELEDLESKEEKLCAEVAMLEKHTKSLADFEK